jgi:hypothetical protein
MRCAPSRARGASRSDSRAAECGRGRRHSAARAAMSARQLRAARRREDAIAGVDDDASGAESEDAGAGAATRAGNPFAALLGDEDEDEDEDEDDETRAAAEPTREPTREPTKKARRRGGKKRAGKRDGGGSDDEFDALVREVTGLDVSAAAAENATVSRGKSGATAASSLLCVDMRNMKAEDELKRIFGGKVISAVEAEEVGRLGGRTAAFRAKLQRRCTFSAYRDQWSTYRSGGLYMVTSGVVDAESGMSDFSFAWKDDYAQANFDFEIAVGSHDPNRLFSLLNHYPWHLETLLRISELYHYSGQAQESSEILERCLYACERAWHPNFTAAASSGLAHLDASQPENKPMFEALFRHVIALTRRGCHKTALECAKLCLGLDHTDPKGMLHMISYFALRSGEEEWLLRFVEDFGHKRWVGGKWELHGSLLNFPDFAYSKAMALYTIADDIKVADAELLKAMLTYPYALTATLMRLEAAVSSDKDWKEILAHEHFDFSNCALDSRSLEHVSDIFATRHHLLWRPDPILHWAKRVARSAIQLVDSMKPSDMIDGLTAAEFVTISLQNWPASEENDFTHLVDDDFTDVVKRALPEDDPLAARGPNDPDHFSDDDDGDEF